VNGMSESLNDMDSRRLAAFERVYMELAESMVSVPAELEKLKAEGKSPLQAVSSSLCKL